MRARELRDVLEVIVLPSLWSALQELNKPSHFSRRKVRLLVKQSFDQLRLMAVEPKSAGGMPELEFSRAVMPPVLKPGESLPLDRLDELSEPRANPA